MILCALDERSQLIEELEVAKETDTGVMSELIQLRECFNQLKHEKERIELQIYSQKQETSIGRREAAQLEVKLCQLEESKQLGAVENETKQQALES